MDYMVSDRRSVKADRCIWNLFQIINLREKTKHHSLLKTFYKQYLLDKKRRINNNNNVLLGVWAFGPSKPVGVSANPFQIVNLRERKQNIILCWKPFTKNIYWIKKEESIIIIMDYIVSAFGWSAYLQNLSKSWIWERKQKTSFSVGNLLKQYLLDKKGNVFSPFESHTCKLVEGEVIGVNLLKP